MAKTTERKQHIRVRETQMEIPTKRPAFAEDFEEKLSNAQSQLETLQDQRRELERQKVALEELNHRKQEFLNGQLELSEKFSNAITTIERELFEMKQEIEDLDQTRHSFTKHLKRIENLNPESWPKETLDIELKKSLSILDQAEDEYEQAASYFTGTRKGSIFGASSHALRSHSSTDFHTMLRNGMAFNLPVIILGSLALLIFLFK